MLARYEAARATDAPGPCDGEAVRAALTSREPTLTLDCGGLRPSGELLDIAKAHCGVTDNGVDTCYMLGADLSYAAAVRALDALALAPSGDSPLQPPRPPSISRQSHADPTPAPRPPHAELTRFAELSSVASGLLDPDRHLPSFHAWGMLAPGCWR